MDVDRGLRDTQPFVEVSVNASLMLYNHGKNRATNHLLGVNQKFTNQHSNFQNTNCTWRL